MRMVIAAVTIGILIFTLTGCAKDKSVMKKDDEINLEKSNTTEEISIDNQVEDKGDISEEITEDIQEEEEQEEKEHKEKIEQEDSIPQKKNIPDIKNGNGEDESAKVIAKSDNAVASKEKEEILNEIDQLLDDVFNSINEMDDLEDKDLEVEN